MNKQQIKRLGIVIGVIAGFTIIPYFAGGAMGIILELPIKLHIVTRWLLGMMTTFAIFLFAALIRRVVFYIETGN